MLSNIGWSCPLFLYDTNEQARATSSTGASGTGASASVPGAGAVSRAAAVSGALSSMVNEWAMAIELWTMELWE